MCVCTALILVALLSWPWAREAYHLTKTVALAVLAVPAFAAWWVRGRPGWGAVPRWYLAVFGAYLAWALLRSVGGVDWPSACLRAGEWLVTVLLAASALGLPERDRRKALAALVAGASLAVLIAFAQVVWGRGLLSPYAVDARSLTFTAERVASTFGNPIFFGAFLVFVLPLVAAKAARRHEAARRLETHAAVWPWVVAGGLMLAGLVLSASRGAFLGLAAALGFLALAVPRLRRWAAGAAGAAAAVLLVLGLWRPALVEHLLVFGDPGRLLMWKTAVRMWQTAPLGGTGLGQFTQRYPCVQLDVATPGDAGFGVNAVHAHNDYLEEAAELGLPGVLLFAAALFGLMALPGRGVLSWGARAGIFAIAVQALFNFVLRTAPTMSFVWILPAIFIFPAGDGGTRVPRKGDACWILAMVALVLLCRPFLRSSYVQMGLAYQDAGTEAATRDPSRVREFFGKSVAYFDRALLLLPDDAQTRIGFLRGKTLFDSGDLPGAQAEYVRDLDRFPCYPEGYGHLGVVYGVRAMNGEMELLPKAQELIMRALRLRPGGKEAANDYNSLANIRVLARNEPGALESYREALRCDPGSVEAASNAVRLLLLRKRRAEAQDIVRALLAAKPDDPEARAMARAVGVVAGP